MNAVTQPLVIWRAQLKALYNTLRHPAGLRGTFWAMLVFDSIVSAWSISQLITHMAQWRALGPATLNDQLWLLVLIVWEGALFFSVLGMLQSLSSDEALLLYTLPLAPATSFRALFGSFFVEQLWNVMLLQAVIMGTALVVTLGWQALAWLTVLELGIAVTVLCTIALVLVSVRLFVPHARTRMLTLAVSLLALLLIVGALFAGKGSAKVYATSFLATPWLVALLFALLLAVALGPLASPLGRLCYASFCDVQSRDRGRRVLLIPGAPLVSHLLDRRRTLLFALLQRELWNQSRNWLFWLRITVTLVLLALFPFVRVFVQRYGVSDVVFATCYAAGVALFHTGEVAVNAISGEADRLTLYLVAPQPLARILRAKLLLFLLPVMLETWCFNSFLCWRLMLSPGQFAFTIVASALIVTANVALLVYGGGSDEDPNLAVDGLQALLLEEAPLSPRRMGVVNLTMLLYAGMVVALWKLTAPLALAALLVLCTTTTVLSWRFAILCLRNCVRQA